MWTGQSEMCYVKYTLVYKDLVQNKNGKYLINSFYGDYMLKLYLDVLG